MRVLQLSLVVLVYGCPGLITHGDRDDDSSAASSSSGGPPPASGVAATPFVLGAEAKVDLPDSALWSSSVNFRPGHGEEVHLNPPRMSWSYTPNPRDVDPCSGSHCLAMSPKLFILQASYSPEELTAARALPNPLTATLVHNIRTASNAFNTLPPFQPPTVGGRKAVHWQVGYIKPREADPNQPMTQHWTLQEADWEPTPYAWSDIRTFYIAEDAEDWDRSMLTNHPSVNQLHTGYLQEYTHHPFMYFNNRPWSQDAILTTREALLSYLQNLEQTHMAPGAPRTEMFEYARGWRNAKQSAADTIAAPWWPTTKPEGVWGGHWAQQIATVAFVWQLTKDHPEITNPNNPAQPLADAIAASQPHRALVTLARFYMDQEGPRVDQIVDQQFQNIRKAVALGYDWWFELFDPRDPAQLANRQEVLRALDHTCRYAVKGGLLYNSGDWGSHDATGAYPGPFFTVRQGNLPKHSAPHPIDIFHTEMIHALAGWPDSDACKELFDLGVNYMIGVTYPWGFGGAINSGRMYGVVNLFGPALPAHMAFAMSFPEAQFRKNPFWHEDVDWWSRMDPVRFTEGHSPWGCIGGGRNPYGSFGKELAYFTGSGRAFKHWRAEVGRRYSDQPAPMDELVIPFHFQLTTPEEPTLPLSKVFLQDGWAVGCSHPVNTYPLTDTPDERSCFDEGVGFIFQARPSGRVNGAYSYNSDLSFQLWAYGATLTDAGFGITSRYGHSSMAHYSLLFNGRGTFQSSWNPSDPYYSRIYAYREHPADSTAPAFTYVAGDATAAYPHRENEEGGTVVPSMDFVTKAHRHLLFVRHKYFVFLDELRSSRPVRMTWLYHTPALYRFNTSKPMTTSSNVVEDPNAAQNEVYQENSLVWDGTRPSFAYRANSISVNRRPPTHHDASGRLVIDTVTDVHVNVAHIFRPEELVVADSLGTDVAINTMTGENYSSEIDEDTSFRTHHALWVSTRHEVDDFKFMTVVYPRRDGEPEPVIQRESDTVVLVNNGYPSSAPEFEQDVVQFLSRGDSPHPWATLAVETHSVDP